MTNTEIRAVFLDIDGTIVHDGKLMPSAMEAVSRLQSRGIKVGLCTGRSILHTEPIQTRLQIQHAVYFNGGLTVSQSNLIASSPLEQSVVRKIMQFSDRHHLPIILHSRHDTLITHPIPNQFKWILDSYQFPPLIEISDDREPANSIYQSNLFADTRWDRVLQTEIPECLLYRWSPVALDLQKRGLDKANGALALLEKWEIPPSEAMHVGDGGNDIGMFQAMGTSVAMGNADASVKEYAQHVTDTVEKDGVLKSLEKLKLI